MESSRDTTKGVRSVQGVGIRRAKFLAEAGIETVGAIVATDVDELEDVRWFGPKMAPKIQDRARSVLEAQRKEMQAVKEASSTRLLLVGADEAVEEFSVEGMKSLVRSAISESERLEARDLLGENGEVTESSKVEIGFLKSGEFGQAVADAAARLALDDDLRFGAMRDVGLTHEEEAIFWRAWEGEPDDDEENEATWADVRAVPFLDESSDEYDIEMWQKFAWERTRALEWTDEVIVVADGDNEWRFRKDAQQRDIPVQTLLKWTDEGMRAWDDETDSTEQMEITSYTPDETETYTAADIGPSRKAGASAEASEADDDEDDEWANCVRNPWKHDKYESSAHDDGPRAGSVADMESEEWHDGPFDTDEGREDGDEPEVGGGVGNASWGATK